MSVDLQALLENDPSASVKLRVGDVLVYEGHEQEFWTELLAPTLEFWEGTVITKTRASLERFGIVTEVLSVTSWSDDEGIGTRYEVVELRLRVAAFYPATLLGYASEEEDIAAISEALEAPPEAVEVPAGEFAVVSDVETEERYIEAGPGIATVVVAVSFAVIAVAGAGTIIWLAGRVEPGSLSRATEDVAVAVKRGTTALVIVAVVLLVLALKEGSKGVRAVVPG